MLRGALVTALVASSLACGGDAIGADDALAPEGRARTSTPSSSMPPALKNVLRDVSEEYSGASSNAASRRLLARSAAPDRDNGSCDVHAPSRFADLAARAPLWGGGAAQPTHPSVVRSMNAQGWRDPQLVVPRPGDAAQTSNDDDDDDDDWIAHAHDMLATTQFFVTTPTITERVADDLRRYVFRLRRATTSTHQDVGCVGNLANCKERFDMPLRLSHPVAAMNQYVRTMKPVIERELGPNAEPASSRLDVRRVSGPIRARRRPVWAKMTDFCPRSRSFRTPRRHGPTEVLFRPNWTSAHATSAGRRRSQARMASTGLGLKRLRRPSAWEVYREAAACEVWRY